jgi:hypothetical protein
MKVAHACVLVLLVLVCISRAEDACTQQLAPASVGSSIKTTITSNSGDATGLLRGAADILSTPFALLLLVVYECN